MRYFRRRQPVVVAIQYNGFNDVDIKKLSINIYGPFSQGNVTWLEFESLEKGKGIVNMKDWIIRDDNGQLSSKNPDDFRSEYEPIRDKDIIEP